MQYEGEELKSILRKQAMHVEVVDYSGHVCFSAPGADILCRFQLDGYVGVGNNSRIRVVKPFGVRYRPDEFGSRRQIEKTFDESGRLSPDAHMNRPKGAKIWPVQPSRARTGRGGRCSTINFRP